jgi:hypothetical protein
VVAHAGILPQASQPKSLNGPRRASWEWAG